MHRRISRSGPQVCLIIAIVLYFTKAFGATIDVPSVDHPTIQAGIDAAVDGDTVLVADGTYSGVGNYIISFNGKAISVRSENGPSACIIDAQAQGRGFVFENDEGPEAELNGFTITNCETAIYCLYASPTISNCIIRNNYSVGNGGGLSFRYSSASITDCEISDNTAESSGGGIYADTSPLTISNCTFNHNSAIGSGGAIAAHACAYTGGSFSIQNCIFDSNSSDYNGGGLSLSQSNATMTNCIVANNTSGAIGGGLYVYYAHPVIVNCTIYGNSSAGHGGGITFKSCSVLTTLKNSILWGNAPEEISNGDYDPSNPTVTFCNVQGGYDGEGNFQGAPLFADPLSGDFRLAVRSPCIDAGTTVGAPDTAIDGNPRPIGDGVDVGAYELEGFANTRPRIETFTIASHPVSLPLEVSFTCRASDPDGEIVAYTLDFGDGTTPATNTTGEFTHTYTAVDGYATCSAEDDAGLVVNSRSISPLLNGVIEVPADYPDIQSAIDAAADNVNTTVLVADGTYTGEGNRDIDFRGKAITVTSRNGPDKTIIHCERAGPGVVFQNDEGPSSVLSGFTIMYGMDKLNQFKGGAIRCRLASPTIRNCIIKNNEDGGINIYSGSPLIENCVITENRTSYYGGGIYMYGGSEPTISACRITRNLAMGPGAGGGTGGGGGIYCHSSYDRANIVNSLISENIARSSGGGIRGGAYRAINCTFSGNIAMGGAGGAIYHYSSDGSFPKPNLVNCILWDNYPNQIISGSPAYSNPIVNHSAIQGGYPGDGNITQNPLFIDPDGGNFQLQSGSPCIDTGTPDGAPDSDLEASPRPMIYGFDMGAFESSTHDPLQPVVGSFTADVRSGDVPLTVYFSCAATDTDGAIVSYAMDYGDGGEIESNTSGNFSHVYDSAGQSFAQCTAMDNDGKTVQSKSIAIRHQGTIHVPADYTTIQAAVDAALEGDRVLVADGTFTGEMNKNILYWGKAITVQSANGPESTIIDCQHEGRGFSFVNYEDTDAVASGFSIINGRVDSGGGGIMVAGSSPTIDNCIIQGNSSTGTSTGGGGICCIDYASPIIVNSTISGNTSGRWGGGLYLHTYAYPVIINSKITENTAEWGGGGVYNYWYSFASIRNSEIRGNVVVQGSGGGIRSAVSYLIVHNSIIAGNRATYRGGGIHVETNQFSGIDAEGNNAVISGCTISDNTAIEGGGIFYHLFTPAPTTNSIIWNNVPDEIDYDIPTPRSGMLAPSVNFCSVKGGFPGNGNIDAEPLFFNAPMGDYHLRADSPCIDGGTSDLHPVIAALGPIVDIDEEPRPVGIRYDMGADEFFDADSDKLPDYREPTLGTDPLDPDTDDDGILDGWEAASGLDPLAADAGQDPDGDSLTNAGEYLNSTDPFDPDSDGDGLNDGDEVILGTEPLDADSDNDGLPDGWEAASGLDPLANDADQDPDGDGLTNADELRHATNPLDPDSDDDELDDGEEVILGTDPSDADSDNDGMPDGWEAAHGLNFLANDAGEDPDGDRFTNLTECRRGTDPRDPSSCPRNAIPWLHLLMGD